MMYYIFLDNDGVLNALSGKPPKNNTSWFGDWGSVSVEGFPMLWSHELIDELQRINERADVQFVVLSTWRQQAKDEVFPLMGLDTTGWPVLDADSEAESYTGGWGPMDSKWWKLEEVEEFIKDKPEGDRFVWLDDDLPYDRGAQHFLPGRNDFFSVAPNTSHGLTRKQVRSILEFLDN